MPELQDCLLGRKEIKILDFVNSYCFSVDNISIPVFQAGPILHNDDKMGIRECP
jgi:hypothetical protein